MSHIEPDFTKLSAQALLQREYVQALESKQAVLEQIITELFMLAEPGPKKHVLWRRYEQVKQQGKPFHEPLEGISGI